MNAEAMPLLRVSDLHVGFSDPDRGDVEAIRGVSFEIRSGEFFGMIGETGAGKSLTAAATLGFVPGERARWHGDVDFDGQRLSAMPERERRKIRGGDIGIIVQNPRSALSPMTTVGAQIATVHRAHVQASKKAAAERAVEGLRAVGIADPRDVAKAYPHQLSGGMAQRAMIAMALVNEPRLLIADEPTTGLDVTVQAEILDLLASLVRDRGTAIWCITHDLGIIANYAARAAVMFAGEIVEQASREALFDHPQHPYTRGLIESVKTATRGDRLAIGGRTPDLRNRPPGCQFAYRCPWREAICTESHPALIEQLPGHLVRCHVAARRNLARAQVPAGVEDHGDD